MSHDAYKVGVIMLNTRFPRPVGDIGNPASFAHPVEFEMVSSATINSVVTNSPISPDVVQGFKIAARSLVEKGCTVITTSCGFACSIHDELQSSIDVPLVSSSLNQVPALVKEFGWHVTLPVITFDSRILSKRHFGRFWSSNVVIQGIEDGKELHNVLKKDLQQLDLRQAEHDVLASVERVLSLHPSSKAVLLECTNLPPYRSAIERRFGLPVYDIFTAINRLARASQPVYGDNKNWNTL